MTPHRSDYSRESAGGIIISFPSPLPRRTGENQRETNDSGHARNAITGALAVIRCHFCGPRGGDDVGATRARSFVIAAAWRRRRKHDLLPLPARPPLCYIPFAVPPVYALPCAALLRRFSRRFNGDIMFFFSVGFLFLTELLTCNLVELCCRWQVDKCIVYQSASAGLLYAAGRIL